MAASGGSQRVTFVVGLAQVSEPHLHAGKGAVTVVVSVAAKSGRVDAFSRAVAARDSSVAVADEDVRHGEVSRPAVAGRVRGRGRIV